LEIERRAGDNMDAREAPEGLRPEAAAYAAALAALFNRRGTAGRTKKGSQADLAHFTHYDASSVSRFLTGKLTAPKPFADGLAKFVRESAPDEPVSETELAELHRLRVRAQATSPQTKDRLSAFAEEVEELQQKLRTTETTNADLTEQVTQLFARLDDEKRRSTELAEQLEHASLYIKESDRDRDQKQLTLEKLERELKVLQRQVRELSRTSSADTTGARSDASATRAAVYAERRASDSPAQQRRRSDPLGDRSRQSRPSVRMSNWMGDGDEPPDMLTLAPLGRRRTDDRARDAEELPDGLLRRTQRRWLLVVVCALVIVLIAGLSWIFWGDSNSSTPRPPGEFYLQPRSGPVTAELTANGSGFAKKEPVHLMVTEVRCVDFHTSGRQLLGTYETDAKGQLAAANIVLSTKITCSDGVVRIQATGAISHQVFASVFRVQSSDIAPDETANP
jgi:hypothetical protein